MDARMNSDEIHAASQIHLAILDEFIRVVEGKIDTSMAPFLRDSLSDLLSNLADQREAYTVLTEDTTLAA